MTTNNIGSGQTYTTIQAWEDDTVVTSSPWIGVIQDNANFDETVTFAGGTGTPDITNHVRLEVASGVRALGVAGAGARIDNTSADIQAVLISSNFVHIMHLEITRSGASPGASDEAIRLSGGVTDILLEKAILHTALTDADTDGIYIGNNTDADITLLNCIVYGWQRGGIHIQNTTGGTDITVTVNTDFCDIYACGAAGENSSGALHSQHAGTNSQVFFNPRCSAFMDTASTFDDWAITGTEPKIDVVGEYNITSDASQSSRDVNAEDIITNKLESITSSNVWTDAANGDFTKVASGDADGAGIDLSGSKADSRGDYTTDIADVTRPDPPSIGAFDLGTPPAGGAYLSMTLLGVG